MIRSQKFRISESLAILLAIVIAVGGFMASPLYEQGGKTFASTEGDFDYQIKDSSSEYAPYGNGAYIQGYDGDVANPVVIPASLGGEPVVSAFLDNGIEASGRNKPIRRIKSIDTSACLTLQHLDIAGNEIDRLDVSRNSALRSLSCGFNNLQALDVSGNPSLEFLWCVGNELTTLDVSKNSALGALNCSSNQLSALDLRGNTILKSLDCYGNKLKTLDLSANVALVYLDANVNALTSIVVNKNPALERLKCSNNKLTSLDVSKLANLKSLYCSYNLLKVLNLSGNPFLRRIDCSNNLLKDLNVDHLSQLTSDGFNCVNNRITNAATQQALIARFGRKNVLPQLDENDLTVVGGSGSGAFSTGKVVNIKADPAPAGKVFDRWVTNAAGAIPPAGLTAEETTFTMPAADVTVTATWKTLLTNADIQLTVDKKVQKGQTAADKLWTGKQICPAVVVKAGNTILKAGTDYTVTYAANVAIGKATATITGQGAYSGVKTFTFKILPKKMSIKKLTTEKARIKAVWTKAAAAQNVTKIQLRCKLKGAKKWTTKTLSAKTATLTIQKLKKGQVFQFQLRSYKTVGKAKYYSPWSATKTSNAVK